MIKMINGVSILLEVNGTINTPTKLPVLLENGDYDVRTINHWSPFHPSAIDMTKKGDYIFEATVNGSGNNTGLVSVVVGRPEEQNPPSEFTEKLDDFGLPKVDIETADIPAVDAYEFLKAKSPRNLGEDYALHQYRELLHMRMVLASDINKARNAIIEIEKYLLAHPFSNYYKDIQNVGYGAKVHKGDIKESNGKIAQLRTIVGDGEVDIYQDRDEIEIFSPVITAGENIEIERRAGKITISADIPDGGETG